MNADNTMEFILPFADFDVDRILGKLPSGRPMSWLASDRKSDDVVVIKEVGFAAGSDPKVWVNRAWPGWARIREVRPGNRSGIYIRDFVAGTPLKAPASPRKVRECLEMIAGIAETLKPLHQMGVAHGRLKPANLIVAEGVALPYITDPTFDPMNSAPKPSGDDTSDAGMAFDPHYVAPEQVRSGAPTPASDIYSLGCILYEQLTCKKPFASPNPLMTCYQQAMTPMPNPALHGVVLDRDTLALLQDMMAKAPAERPANAMILIERLKPLLDNAFNPGAMTGTFVMPRAILEKAMKDTEGGKAAPMPPAAETVSLKSSSDNVKLDSPAAHAAAAGSRKAAAVADPSLGKEQETVVFTPEQLKTLFETSTPVDDPSRSKIRLNDSARIPIVETVSLKLEDLRAAKAAEEKAKAAAKAAPAKREASPTETIDANATLPLPAGYKPGGKPPAETVTLPQSAAAADAVKKAEAMAAKAAATAKGPAVKAPAPPADGKPAKKGGGFLTVLLLLYSLFVTLLLLGAVGYILYLLKVVGQ